MKRNSIYTVGFGRKREGFTDYRKRLRLLASNKLRLVVRKSLKNIQASITEYGDKGDIIKASAHSSNLKKLGWDYNTGNLPAAYLVGFLVGKKAKLLGEITLDIGPYKSVRGSRFYALLAGALDAGLKIPHNKKILPGKERITGNHIAKYAELLKKNDKLLKKQFFSYIKNNKDIANIVKNFEDVKKNIGAMKEKNG